MNLRAAAKGKPCMIRLEGICNGNPETTVLCHFRLVGVSGMGMKSPDLIGAWGCDACHRFCDSNKDDHTQLAFARGVFRTQVWLLNDGMIEI